MDIGNDCFLAGDFPDPAFACTNCVNHGCTFCSTERSCTNPSSPQSCSGSKIYEVLNCPIEDSSNAAMNSYHARMPVGMRVAVIVTTVIFAICLGLLIRLALVRKRRAIQARRANNGETVVVTTQIPPTDPNQTYYYPPQYYQYPYQQPVDPNQVPANYDGATYPGYAAYPNPGAYSAEAVVPSSPPAGESSESLNANNQPGIQQQSGEHLNAPAGNSVEDINDNGQGGPKINVVNNEAIAQLRHKLDQTEKSKMQMQDKIHILQAALRVQEAENVAAGRSPRLTSLSTEGVNTPLGVSTPPLEPGHQEFHGGEMADGHNNNNKQEH